MFDDDGNPYIDRVLSIYEYTLDTYSAGNEKQYKDQYKDKTLSEYTDIFTYNSRCGVAKDYMQIVKEIINEIEKR